MPITLKLPSTIASHYEVVREISEGQMAWSFEAWDLEDPDRKVFLKYYKSPTPTVSWYKEYVQYVNKINNILASSNAAQNCVLCTDLFIANPRPGSANKHEYLFQAFDFVEGGYDMKEHMLAGINYRDRVTMAMLFLDAMKGIHEAGIVHCDLKPENVQMIELNDPSVELKWIPRMIDMDRSIIEDEVAPWTEGDDREGYVGTPGYYSPEHLTGQTPQKGSDVFTIGIILGELLGGKHPFSPYLSDSDVYKKAVLEERYEPVSLITPLEGDTEDVREFERLINQCFSSDIDARPTCEELHKALMKADNPSPARAGKCSCPAKSDTKVESAPVRMSEPPSAPPADKSPALLAMTLTLIGDLNELPVRLQRSFSKKSLRDVSSDAERFCASREQFKLDYDLSSHVWYIEPPTSEPRNPTALNGNFVTGRVKLNNGDIICLKSRTSGKTAMELKVSIKPLYR